MLRDRDYLEREIDSYIIHFTDVELGETLMDAAEVYILSDIRERLVKRLTYGQQEREDHKHYYGAQLERELREEQGSFCVVDWLGYSSYSMRTWAYYEDKAIYEARWKRSGLEH